MIVLGSGRWESTELEMALIQNPIAARSMVSGTGTRRKHEVNHDRSGLPLSRWDAGVEVAETGLEEGLTDVSPRATAARDRGTMLLTHRCRPLPLAGSRSDTWPGELVPSLGAAPESLKRVDPSGRPAGREVEPRYSKWSSCNSRGPVITPDLERSW